MNIMRCHRCQRGMAASFFVCPHCGAVQDEQGRAESAANLREALLIAAPTLHLMVAGGLIFQARWAVAAGFVLGIVIGMIVVATLHIWRDVR